MGDGMATMSIRGLDEKTLGSLKRRAEREGSSVNSLVVRLLQQENGTQKKPAALQEFDDLDTLAGTWTRRQARAFERDTAAFSEVDPALWK
jgi:plasmid stability protein